MKKIFFILFFIPIICFSQSKTIVAELLVDFTLKADEFIGFDSYNSCYYIEKNVLYKKQNDKIYQYQNVQFGKISKVDLVNPLKILIFYADFNSVVVLDNQFNEIQTISFSSLENPVLVSAVGLSIQNKLWIYSASYQQIGLYELASKKINYINVPIKEKFVFYQSDLNYFNWIDSNSNWYTTNLFGNVVSNGTVNSIEKLQIINDTYLMYQKDNAVFLENRLTKNEYKINNIENSFDKMFYKDQILSIFTNHKILRYKIILP